MRSTSCTTNGTTRPSDSSAMAAMAERSVEILRQVVSNVELADVRAQVGLSLFTDFENFTTFKPGPHLEPTVTGMLDQVIAWGGALKPLRAPKSD
jgi:BRCT domain type II-containing protein